jgi:DNA-binding MarR family transcriptional regulator
MLDKMSDTSRIVDRLVVKGFVKKTPCSKDKRLVDVLITEKGQRLLKKLDAEADHITEVMGKLTDEEANQLSHLLDKLRNTG